MAEFGRVAHEDEPVGVETTLEGTLAIVDTADVACARAAVMGTGDEARPLDGAWEVADDEEDEEDDALGGEGETAGIRTEGLLKDGSRPIGDDVRSGSRSDVVGPAWS